MSHTVDKKLKNIESELLDIQSGLKGLQAKSFNEDDLNPFQDRLRKLDSQRVNQCFVVGSEIPEGQAILSELLNDCYDTISKCQDNLEGGGFASQLSGFANVKVSNLPLNADEKMVSDFFSWCGYIQQLYFQEEAGFKSAIVCFQTDYAAKAACLLSGSHIDGQNKITVVQLNKEELPDKSAKVSSKEKITKRDIISGPMTFSGLLSQITASGYTLASDALTKAKQLDESYGITEKASQVSHSAAETVKGITENVVGTASNLGSTVVNTASNVASSMSTTASNLVSGVSDLASKAQEQASNVASNVSQSLSDAGTKIQEGVSYMTSQAQETGASLSQKMNETASNIGENLSSGEQKSVIVEEFKSETMIQKEQAHTTQ